MPHRVSLIAASEGEGFGLPLVEAARHRLPVVARDIPVFREVAGEHAHYFNGIKPADLARAIRDWLELDKQKRAPQISGMRYLTWDESAASMTSAIFGALHPSLDQKFMGNRATSWSWKVLLGSPARLLYRCIRPFARPILFRIRRYFLDDIRQELLEARRTSLSELRRIAQQLEELRRNIRARELRKARSTPEVPQAELINSQHNGAMKLETLTPTPAQIARKQDPGQLGPEITASHLARPLSYAVPASGELNSNRPPVEVPQDFDDQWLKLAEQLLAIEKAVKLGDWRVALRAGDDVLLKSNAGYVLCPASDHAQIACLLDSGDLERGTRLLIERLLREGDTYVDIGANIGLHCLGAANAMNGIGRVIAFEPHERVADLMRRSMLINGFGNIVTIFNAAASDKSGRGRLYLSSMTGWNSLYPLDAGAAFQLRSRLLRWIRRWQILTASLCLRLMPKGRSWMSYGVPVN